MLVLVILGVIWAAVLLPPYLHNRRESRPGDSIATFRSQLHTLERTTPGSSRSNLSRLDVGRYEAPQYQPRGNVSSLANRGPQQTPAVMRRAEARRRRRDVFLTLLAGVGVTLVLGVALGGVAWMAFGLTFVALGLYTAMLVAIQQQAAERDVKVRYMPPSQRRPDAQLALRRYGS